MSVSPTTRRFSVALVGGEESFIGATSCSKALDSSAGVASVAMAAVRRSGLATPRTSPVCVGNDAKAPVNPGTSDPLPSFDLDVDRGGNHGNVEVQSSQCNILKPGDLGDAINHAAEKSSTIRTSPEGDRTKGVHQVPRHPQRDRQG